MFAAVALIVAAGGVYGVLSYAAAARRREMGVRQALGADSLDIVELVMEFEKEFGIDIPDEDAEKLRTVGDAVAYLEAKVAG